MKVLITIILLSTFIGELALSEPMDQIRDLCFSKKQDFQMKSCQSLKLVTTQLTGGSRKLLIQLVENSTDSWPDSILESDVDTNFEDLKIDSTTSISNKKTNELLGYRVRFSYRGWETSCVTDDSYDRAKPETYKKCKVGRLTQTIFVSSDLHDYEVLVDADLKL